MDRRQRLRRLQRAAVAAGLLPLLWLIAGALRGALGANPVETITHTTGAWALRLLVLTLAITPLRRLTGWQALAPFRRTAGLLAFGYAALHFATWVVLDLGFDLAAVAEDVAERPYITVGFATFLVLVPLAATSTRPAMRRLGRAWNRLHRLVYLAALGAVVHFLWLVKADLREPAIYGAIVAVLLGARLGWWLSSRRASLRTRPLQAPAGR